MALFYVVENWRWRSHRKQSKDQAKCGASVEECRIVRLLKLVNPVVGQVMDGSLVIIDSGKNDLAV